jgi:hypothetical protein
MAKPKPSLRLIHWHDAEAEELAAPLRAAGWAVTLGLPTKLSELKEKPPAAVVVSLRRLPSHGREAADAVWSTKWGRAIPIVFCDGAAEKVGPLRAKFPAATFTTFAELPGVLAALPDL